MGYGLIQIQLSERAHRCSIHPQWSLVPIDPARGLHQLPVAKHDHLLMLETGPKDHQQGGDRVGAAARQHGQGSVQEMHGQACAPGRHSCATGDQHR